MKIKPDKIFPDPVDPFKDCKLGRKNYAEVLTRLVGNYKEGFVLAINSEWGTGKTTFIEMWQKHLELNEFKTVYFNAWENDFDINPLAPILSELEALKGTDKVMESTFESLKKNGEILLRKTLPKVIKSVSKKYLGEDIGDVMEAFTEGATEILEEEIDEYKRKKQSVAAFRSSLEKFINESKLDKPLIFIIDELDRCKPNYAVEVLEKIKHFFAVKRIIFVLSIDKIQLGNAVRGVYGSDRIDSDEYLRKFIDIEYSLPAPNPRKYCKYLFDYFEFEKFSQNAAISLSRSLLLNISVMICSAANIKLRQQEKLFAHARIALTLFKQNELIFPDVYMVFIFLRHFHIDFYRRIEQKRIKVQDFLNELSTGIPSGGRGLKRIVLIYSEAFSAFLYNEYIEEHYKLVKGSGISASLYVRSRFDETGNQEHFAAALNSIESNKLKSSYKLENLLDKINLT